MPRCHELVAQLDIQAQHQGNMPRCQTQCNVKWEPPWFDSCFFLHIFKKMNCIVFKCSAFYKTDVKLCQTDVKM